MWMIGSDIAGIVEVKQYLAQHFVTEDMRKPKYFLGIEFAYARDRLILSQRKYVLDMLQETGLLRCKPKVHL